MSSRLTAIVMLSGLSTRMNGKDKLLIEINGQPIVQYVFDTIAQCGFAEVIAVCRKKEIMNIALSYGFKALLNKKFKNGISESIKLGVSHANENSNGYMFFQGDQILIKKEHIEKLQNCFLKNNQSIIAPKYNGIASSPCIFPKKLKNKLLLLEGDEGGKKIMLNCSKGGIIFVNIESDKSIIDIDNINDLREVMSILNN